MKLIKLTLLNNITKKEIRTINFNRSGVSLIVDESESNISGSNIGKTTAVKVIDLCLGAKSISSLYKEKDTGENFLVKEFLKNNKITAILEVEINGLTHTLERELYNKGKKYIDGKESSNLSDYWKELNKLVFNNNTNNPSFRQLIVKFIRLDYSNENALLKFLGSFPKSYEYQAIYDYLYGIDTSSSENTSLIKENDQIDKDINVILRKNCVLNIEEFDSKISLLKEEVVNLKDMYKKLTVANEFESKEEVNDHLLEKLNKQEAKVSKLKFKESIYYDKIEREKNNISTLDFSILKVLFEETKASEFDIIKDFESLEKFHNGMIEKRINLLNNALSEIKKKKLELENELKMCRDEYELNYITFNSELKEQFEEAYESYFSNKERLENLLSDRSYVSILIESKNKNNGNIVESKNKVETIKQIVEILNRYFIDLTKCIIGEPYRISFTDKGFPVSIVGLHGKPGTGIKKALIACFDLAHINLIIEKGMYMPIFIIHDKMENIDLKELKGIIKKARDFKGQYIFPILSDRITTLGIKENEIVLRLSNNDKFFKI